MDDLGDIYNRVADAYSGDLSRDLAERSIPPELAIEISQTAGEWAASVGASRTFVGALGFSVGLMVGVEWARAARS